MNRPSRTSLFFGALFLLTWWNSCSISHVKENVDLIARQADSIERKNIDASDKLDELKTQIEDVKAAVDEIP